MTLINQGWKVKVTNEASSPVAVSGIVTVSGTSSVSGAVSISGATTTGGRLETEPLGIPTVARSSQYPLVIPTQPSLQASRVLVFVLLALIHFTQLALAHKLQP